VNERLDLDANVSAAVLLRAVRRKGLVVRELGSASRGARHWHIRRPEGPGTLELTEADGRVWLTVKPLWDGGWARSLAKRLAGGRA
jgi:hypothetical protein